jgi:N-acetylglucosaminyldiphosphoundecaprenol N-acetyl-beta-D-mannosaminyltransferase
MYAFLNLDSNYSFMLENKVIDVMGYPVFTGRLEDIQYIEDKLIINTLNAYSYVIAKEDLVFNKALTQSDILVPDGFPVVLAARLLRRIKLKKIAGADVFEFFCKKLNTENGKCLFLGASSNSLEKIKEKMFRDYPEVIVSAYSPPFKEEFSADDNRKMTEIIKSVNPDVLFVGMTAPKQEKWVFQNKPAINAKVICSIGAVFDFYAGTNKRPAKLWIFLNLEWFIRLVKEPRRLWKRYLFYSPIFFTDLLRCLLFKKQSYSKKH